MSGQTSFPLGRSVTVADAARWRAESARKREEAKKLIESADSDDKRAEVAEQLFSMLDTPETPDEPPQKDSLPREVSPKVINLQASRRTTTAHAVPADASYVQAVRQITNASELGLAPFEAKAALMQTSFAARLGKSDKGFYHAIERLAERGEIIRHNGRIFSPDAYEKFKKAVASGKIKDDPAKLPTHSPMGDAILRIVGESPGVMGGEIIAALRKDPEFEAALNPHNTGAYNVIARLVSRRQLSKTGDKRYILGKAPL